MRQISTNTWGVDDIVQGKLVDEGRELEEQRQRLCNRKKVSKITGHCTNICGLQEQTNLSNTTRGTSNNYLEHC